MKLLKILYDTYKEEYELNIKEGLTKTYEINQSIGIIERSLKKKGLKKNEDFIIQRKDDNTFDAIIADVNSLDLDTDLIKLANTLGWFPSFLSSKNGYVGKWNPGVLEPGYPFSITFEAKYDEQTGFKIPKYMYHVTLTKNVDKIKKIGLSPRSQSKLSNHPERVYLAKNMETAENLAKEFSRRSPQWSKTPDNDYAILTVDTEKIPGDYFKLYKDPNLEGGGFYTMNNIPPYAIVKIEPAKID